MATVWLSTIAVSDISQRLLPTIVSGTAGNILPETIVGTADSAVVAVSVIVESLRLPSSSVQSTDAVFCSGDASFRLSRTRSSRHINVSAQACQSSQGVKSFELV
jgi:hypothetical protein